MPALPRRSHGKEIWMATLRIVYVLCIATVVIWGISERGRTQTSTEEENCKADLMATGEYVLILKEQRDQCEKEVAKLRYQVNRLTEENIKILQKLKKETKK